MRIVEQGRVRPSREEVGVAVHQHFHQRLALQKLNVRLPPDPAVHVPVKAHSRKF